jgi:exodeoxyribonuclease VII large subunit
VTELTARIRERLDTDPRLHDVWARGETSNVVNHRSGHRYFTLRDRESQISCVLFKSQGTRLDFELADGLNLLVFGDIDLYRPRGQVQLVVRGLKLDAGLGLRHQELEALKRRLAAEGLFEAERKKPLPRFPSSIGIVTSPDGAALRDVLMIMGSYPARIVLSPARVQGDGAPESIASAIRALQRRVEVVIVCRGGGSAEDLWSFNHELVARAISQCDVPVISAIGHETDVTIADFVADARAATPTAAAKMVVPDLAEVSAHLFQTETRMARALWSGLEKRQDRLDHLRRALSARRMYALLGEQRQRLDYIAERLIQSERESREAKARRLQFSEGRLSSVSPLATLARGYALIRSGERLIIRAKEALPGEVLELVFADGTVRCEVLGRGEEGGMR